MTNSDMDQQNSRHYRAIGRVAVEWTRLEGYVAETIRMLAEMDDKYGICVTAQIAGIGRMLDALCALAELRRPGSPDDRNFKKLMDRIQSAAEKRNRVVHDLWTFDPGVTMRWPTSVRRRYYGEPVEMTTAEVDALAAEIEDLSGQFLEFRRTFLMGLDLWPGQ